MDVKTPWDPAGGAGSVSDGFARARPVWRHGEVQPCSGRRVLEAAVTRLPDPGDAAVRPREQGTLYRAS